MSTSSHLPSRSSIAIVIYIYVDYPNMYTLMSCGPTVLLRLGIRVVSLNEDIPRKTHSLKGDEAHARHNVADESQLNTFMCRNSLTAQLGG